MFAVFHRGLPFIDSVCLSCKTLSDYLDTLIVLEKFHVAKLTKILLTQHGFLPWPGFFLPRLFTSANREDRMRRIKFLAVALAFLLSSVMSLTYADMLSRSEEHTSELQSLMRITHAVFCLQQKKSQQKTIHYSVICYQHYTQTKHQ